MEELNLLNGDTVLLRGKKRKTTIAVVHADENVQESRIRIPKITRSNLRFFFQIFKLLYFFLILLLAT
jgi:transitional endoplasmic reticulum ATPase